ncbi:FAD-dependent monooxygenase [Amycolatopsis rifamycinica]|uniref:FAD-binding domain-containing protein n=1 Tax=Amycolatopsis rifamycinica TaxID=287986 RepID=A0A066U3I3_9PSEU|nr:FAD-dependent monooxygenase [Amycolatopsis rifamycinica]KDN20432.1 hypothetical protein DV20_21005 [Amycolatopsis rifamycinica]
MAEELPVLIVGGGPVGLTAAAELARRDIPVRLVDKASEPSPLTKALMVWPRTLEVLRLLGGGEHIETYGLPIDAFRYYSENKQICRIGFGPRTRPSVITQPDVETLLRKSLADAGGTTEWATTLTGLRQDGDGVEVTLAGPDGREELARFSYVLGTDGATSTVRKQIGLEFQGSTYENVFILADSSIEGDLQRDAVHYYCSSRGVMVLVPLYNGRFRVFTAGPPGMRPEDLTPAVLQDFLDKRGPGGLRLYDIDWLTTFSIHARHAEKFHVGRVFLAGDSAHVHSPAGGQGLNTGVTDAHNLAWKLALVHRGHAGRGLLDSYGVERASVASAVVKQAEAQTKAWLLKKRWQIAARDVSAGLAERLGLFDRYYAPWLAGLTNHYPAGAAVAGPVDKRTRPSSVLSGHLLPDEPVRYEGTVSALRSVMPIDRYTLLVSRTEDTPELRALLASHRDLLTLRVLHADGSLTEDFTPPPPGPGKLWRPKPFTALVRPDHYVAAVGVSTVRAHLSAITT